MNLSNRLSDVEQGVLQDACQAFETVTAYFSATPVQTRATYEPSVDAAIKFKMGKGKSFDMPVIVSSLIERHLNAPIQKGRRGLASVNIQRPVMLVAPYVSPTLAAQLIAARKPFLDAAGNVYMDEPEATIMVVGRENPALRRRELTGSRSTTPKGLRVMFALATQPTLIAEPYRTIAEIADVSLNTVNVAMDDLIARGLVATKRDKRIVVDRRRFVEGWVNLYPTRLRTKLGVRRFASAKPEWWRDIGFDQYALRLGGEAGAEVLTHELKSATVTLYAHQGVTSDFMMAARLRPDPRGEVEVLDAFWPSAAEAAWQSSAPGLVHPLLIYADLTAAGDSRKQAVAENIYEQYLAKTPT